MGSAGAFARAVATIGATIPLVLWLGVTGAAVAMVLGFAVDLGIMIHTSRRHMVSGFLALWPLRELAVLALAYVVGVVSARAGDVFLSGALGTFIAIVLGAAVYAAVFVLAGELTDATESAFDLSGLRFVVAARSHRGLLSPTGPAPRHESESRADVCRGSNR